MNTSEWKKVATIYEQALELDVSSRDDYLGEQKRAHPEIEVHLDQLIEGGVVEADQFAESLAGELAGALGHQPLAAGETLGAYEIERLLGCGGMGAVYLAHRADRQFEKTVAIKLLPSMLATRQERENFRSEQQHLAGLEHPSIARLIDGGVSTRGQPYYVLEYIEGQTADQFADRATADEVLAAFLRICDAVAHAHARLVIHCDIKPANVLVGEDGNVKLLDFGIARSMGEGGRGGLGYVGTPVTRNYASPELLEGGEVDTRSDVYSLGVMLHRLLTGAMPYQLPAGSRSDVRAALDRVVRAPLPGRERLAGLSPVAVADLETIIERAMRIDRDSRISSVRELADEIRRVRAHRPLAVAPALRAYRLRKAARRNPLAAWLGLTAAASALFSIAILVIALLATRAEQAEAEQANQRLALERETAEQATEFLVSIFDAADPELRKSAPHDFSARELLDASLARLDRLQVSDPRVATRLNLAVGRIANKLGVFDRAKPLLSRVIDQSIDPGLARQALLELGNAQGQGGEEEAGLESLDRVADLCAEAGETECLLEALKSRGSLELVVGKPDQAAATLSHALRVATAVPASERDEGYIATATFGLGVALHKSGESKNASDYFDQASALFRELVDEPTLEAAFANLHLGVIQNHRREYAEAEVLLAKARQIFTDLYGPSHIRIAYVDFIASNVFVELGDLGRAQVAAERSLAVRRDTLGEEHGDTGMSWGRVASVLAARGETTKAIEAAERSRAITATANPTSHANVGLTLARLYANAGELDSAVRVARGSLAYYETKFGRDHAMSLRGHRAVAAALAAHSRLSEAIASQRRAVEIADAKLRPDHPRRVENLVALGELEERAGDRAAATATMARAAELGAKARPPAPELAERARAALAEHGRDRGN